MAESIQKKLTRERPPRVKITYDVETGDAIVKTELPFVMGIIADLSGKRKDVERNKKTVMRDGKKEQLDINWLEYKERSFVEIDKDNFNDVLAEFAPRLKYAVSAEFSADLKNMEIAEGTPCKDLVFNTLDDFKPDSIVAVVPPLTIALAERNLVRDIYTKMDTDEALLKTCFCYVTGVKMNIIDDKGEQTSTDVTVDKLKEVLAKSLSAASASAAEEYLTRRKASLQNLIFPADTPLDDDTVNHQLLIKTLIAEVGAIDRCISKEMDRILHEPDFQALEAAWRGLFNIVRNTATSTGLKLKILNASEEELYNDLTGALDFDQSRLFKMVYEETYGTQGGSPYSCLLHAHYYGKDTRSIEFATQMTAVAAAAHAPLLTSAAPDLFNLESFRDLSAPRDLAKIFESAEHVQWNGLREQEDARYLTMCLPHVLMRPPYVQADVKLFEYAESLGADATSPDHDNYLWGNAAYALGLRITTAFALYGWTAAIRGMEGGGLVEGLAVHNYVRASGDVITKIPTETAITDRREKELSDLGFISLCYRLGTDKAVFFGAQTINKPLKYFEADANANANLSARLPYILNASRFAHYVKSIMRDKIGSFLDRESVEKYLNTWLSNYVLLSDNATQNLKASYPLREGRVDVTEDESDPGVYKAVMYLRPHFQMEELEVSIRLVAKLPAPAA